jgi:tetratricopeptide (TPR) repeat protein
MSCQHDPKVSAEAALRRGDEALKERDYSRALIYYRLAARDQPRSAEPEYRIGVTYLAMLDAQTGLDYLMKANQLDPKHSATQIKIAEVLSMNSNMDLVREAERRAEAVLEAAPRDADALNALAMSEVRLGKSSDAQRHLEQALEAVPSHLKSLVTLANVRLAEKNYPGAEEVLRQLAAIQPPTAQAFVALARLQSMLGRRQDAAASLRRASGLAPEDPEITLSLAEAEEQLGNLQAAEKKFREVAGSNRSQLRTELPLFLIRQGRKPEAIKELERCRAASPSDRRVRTLLVETYRDSGRAADSEKLTEEALKANPSDTDALLEHARLSLQRGDSITAEKDARRVLHFNSKSGEAHHVLAAMYQAGGDSARAQQELADALRNTPGLMEARLDLIRFLIRENKLRLALQVSDETPEQQKNTLAAITARNELLLAMGDQKDAKTGIQQGLAIARTPELLLQLSLLQLNAQDYESARGSAEQALAQDPLSVKALNAIVMTYFGQKQSGKALERVRQYVKQHPQSQALQYYLGQFLESAGVRSEARVAYMAANGKDAAFAPAILSLARLDIAEGDATAARQEISRLLRMDPSNVDALLIAARLALALGDRAAAISHYRAVVNGRGSSSAVAHNGLAYLLADSDKDMDEALGHAQKAVELAPDNPAFADTLGWISYKKGACSAAVHYLELAVSREANARRQYHLAMAYVCNGDTGRGQKTLAGALRADSSLVEAQTARQVWSERGLNFPQAIAAHSASQ